MNTTGATSNQTPNGVININGITNGNSDIPNYYCLISGVTNNGQTVQISDYTTESSITVGSINGGTYSAKVITNENNNLLSADSNCAILKINPIENPI